MTSFGKKGMKRWGALLLLPLGFGLFSCKDNIGLGESVDTEAPTIEISYPPASSAIRGTFIMAGTWDDDQSIASIELTITNTTTKESFDANSVTFTSGEAKTWQVSVNNYDAAQYASYNGWQLPDGKYELSVTAKDMAGHSSGAASRTFEIDNTAPVFILQSPGSTTTATAYGSTFSVEGTIADDHTIAELAVSIYDSEGNVLADTASSPYTVENVSTAGGTSVSLLTFSENPSTDETNHYAAIYGSTNKNEGVKEFSCSATLMDNTHSYTDPSETSNTTDGNATSTFFLYDDVYSTLMSSTTAYGLTAADIMTIINGTYCASDDTSSRAAAIGTGSLSSSELASVTSLLKGESAVSVDTSESHLKFSLNPAVNPSYVVSGMDLDSSPSGTKGQTVTFICSAGLDATTFYPSILRAYIKKFTKSQPSASDIQSFVDDPAGDSDAVCYATNEASTESSVKSYTWATKLPQVVADYWYAVALSGEDQDGNTFIPSDTYGFKAALSGTPPSVLINTPVRDTIYAESGNITFAGYADSSELDIDEISVTVEVVDSDSSTTVGKFYGHWEDGAANTISFTPKTDSTEHGEWNFTFSDGSGYGDTFAVTSSNNRNYSYTLEIVVSDTAGNAGNSSSATRTVSADSMAPVVSISTVSPLVSGESYDDSTNTYVNGTVTVSGTVSKTSLSSLSYTVYVDGNAVDGLTDKALAVASTFKFTLDTTALDDEKEIEVIVTAVDKAGNSGSANLTDVLDSSTNGTFTILQETDNPIIKLTNADATVTDESGFWDGTNQTNVFLDGNKLSATVTDDDGTPTVSVSYRTLGSSDAFTSLTSTYTSATSTLTANLPASYGEFEIKIAATGAESSGSSETTFAIAHDDGNPTFNQTTVDAGYVQTSTSVSGTVNDKCGAVSFALKSTDQGTSASYASSVALNPTTTGGTAFTFTDTLTAPDDDGTYTAIYTATDKYGYSTDFTLNYKHDKTAPVFADALLIAGASPFSSTWYTTESLAVSIPATDALSGISTVTAAWGSSSQTLSPSDYEADASYKLYSASLAFSEGTNSLVITASDQAGNSVSTDAITVKVDSIAPVIADAALSAVTLNKTQYDALSDSGITLTATATDTGSGIKKLWISEAKDGAYDDAVMGTASTLSTADTASEGYAVSISIAKSVLTDGTHTFYLHAADEVGHDTVSSVLTVTVDTASPTLNISTSSNKSYTESDVENGKWTLGGNWKDDVSGTSQLYYQISEDNGFTWSEWTEITGVQTAAAVQTSWTTDISVEEHRGYALRFKAIDDYLNETAEADYPTFTGINFDFSVPTIELTAATEDASVSAGDQVNKVVTYTATVSDALSISKSNITVSVTKDSTTYAYDPSELDWSTEETATDTHTFSFTTPAADDDGSNNGVWSVMVSANDDCSRSATAKSLSVTVDTVAPKVVNYNGTANVIVLGTNGTGTIANWYKDTTLLVQGAFSESLSGLSTVYYYVQTPDGSAPSDDLTGWGSVTVAGTTGSCINYKITPSDFAASSGDTHNILYIVAEDAAGNKCAQATYEIKLDQDAPDFSAAYYTYDASSFYDAGGTVLTNKSQAITLYGSVSDTASGVTGLTFKNADGEIDSSAVTVTYSTVSLSTTTSATFADWLSTNESSFTSLSSASTEVQTWKAVIARTAIVEGTLKAQPVDEAGNGSYQRVFDFQVDETGPDITVSSPSADSTLNGTVTFQGNTSDANSVGSLLLEYSLDSGSTWTSLETKTGSSAYAWSYDIALSYLADDGETMYTLGDTVWTDTSSTVPLKVRLTASDTAGNTSTVTQSYTIDPNSDRPSVSFTSLDTADSWLTTKTLRGSVTDDDGVSKIYISTDSGSNWGDALSLSSGNWSYDLSDVSDGSVTLDFKITDTDGRTFTTAGSYGYLRPYYAYANDASSVKRDTAGSSITVYKDTAVPVLSDPYMDIASSTSLAEVASVVADTTSYACGATRYTGGKMAYIKFYVPVKETNVASVVLSMADDSWKYYKTSTSSLVSLDDTGSALSVTSSSITVSETAYTLYESQALYCADVSTGTKTVTFTVTDSAGNVTTKTANFTVDNDGPTISVTNPKSTEELTSSASLMGTSLDVGGSSTLWTAFLVPKTGTTYNDDYFKAQAGYLYEYALATSADETYSGTASDFGGTNEGSVGAWQYKFKNSSSQTFETYEAYSVTSGSYTYTYDVSVNSGSIDAGNEVWKIPVYFMSVDEVGNYTVKTDYTVLHNPNADIPSTIVSYPNEGDYDTSTDSSGTTTTAEYATIGGQIRVTGTVSIEDTNASLGAVYLQVGKVTYESDGTTVQSVDWSYSDSGSAYTSDSAVTKDGLTIHDAEAVAAELGSALTFVTTTSGSYSAESDFWGIKATDKSSSWNVTLNSGEGLNLDNDTNYIAIRACAFNSNGKMGAWAGPYYVHVDNDVPDMTVTLQQITTLPSSSVVNKQNQFASAPDADAEKTYTADMYLRDPNADWYLVVSFTDASGIDAETISVSGTSSGKYVYPFETVSEGKYNYKVYIPIVTTSASVSYTVLAYDNDQTPKKSQSTYSLNIDNTAPAITALTNTSGTAIDKKKIYNSNKVVTIQSTAEESGSGFYGAAYFFKRTVDETTTIELPAPSFTVSGTTSTVTGGSSLTKTVSSSVVSLSETDSVSDSVSLSGEATDVSGLYGVTLTGGSRGSTTTFTHALVSDYAQAGLIHASGFVRIAGSYYLIESISDDTVTFDSDVPESYTDAFFAMAFVVNNDGGESPSWSSSGNHIIAKDDGDGLVESIEKSGSVYTWDSSFYSDAIEDGPVTICTAVFDKAGNVTSSASSNTAKDTNADAYVMITNNTPRLTKVFLATDLNGDDEYAESEFVQGSVYISRDSSTTVETAAKTYLAALEDSDESVSAVVTTGAMGDWKDSNGDATLSSKLFRISDSSVITVEFVSGYEGYGSGNNGITPYMTLGSSALTAPETASAHALSDFATLSDDVVTWDSASKLGLEIDSTTFSSSTNDTYGAFTESTSSDDEPQYLSLTLWDNTKGTTVGTPDSGLGTDSAVFGAQYTVLNLPVYFDFVDDQAPVVTIDTIEAASATTGHVEQGLMPNTASGEVASKLPSSKFTTEGNGKSSELDQDPKVSGTVVFSGTISDNKRINAITLKMLNSSSSYIYQLKSAQTVASYSDGTLSESTVASQYGWVFAIESQSFSQDEGHTVNWTLTMPTDSLMNDSGRLLSDIDMPLVVSATDYANSHTTATTQYVDVVPYIRSIARSSSGSVAVGLEAYGYINRSKLGHYPVSQGETLTITGFNLYDATVTVGNTDLDESTYSVTTSYTAGTTSFKVPAWSGKVTVTVNGVESLNNINGNPTISANVASSGDYDNNLESFKVRGNSTVYYATDDRYVEVWNLGNYFKNTNNGAELQEPVMTADKLGNLYASWAAQSNSNIMFSYGVAKSSRAIFRFYDQPATTTSVTFDTKGTSGGALVGFIPEHQGSGGTFSDNAMSSSAIDGGMGAIQIPSTYISKETPATSAQNVRITGNPDMYSDGDSKNLSSWYNLANYAMNRRMASFESPSSARFGNYLHTIWYDNVTEGLKYSVVDTSDSANYAYNCGAIAGWVVIDGGYTGQDRVHEWAKAQTYANNTIYVSKSNAHTAQGTGTYNAYYKDNIFFDSVTSSTTTSVTLPAGSYADKYAVGDTIALCGNTAGDYQIALRTITAVNNTTVSWSEAYSGDIDSVTIYGGNMNVLGGTVTSNYSSFSAADNQSTSAGSSSSIDVDTKGRPIIAYLSADDSTLRIARFNTGATVDDAYMKLAANWTRTVVSNTTCSGEVSIRVDGSNNIHVMYKNDDGQLCYTFGTPSGNTYNFNAPEIIDENGSLAYGTLSVRELSSGVYVPVMTYLNSAGTAQAVKYAYRTSAPSYDEDSKATGSVSDDWDYMILPSLGSGHYAVAENKISLEAHKSTWVSTDETVLSNGGSNETATPATVQAAVAFKSKQFETAYLLTEQ